MESFSTANLNISSHKVDIWVQLSFLPSKMEEIWKIIMIVTICVLLYTGYLSHPSDHNLNGTCSVLVPFTWPCVKHYPYAHGSIHSPGIYCNYSQSPLNYLTQEAECSAIPPLCLSYSNFFGSTKQSAWHLVTP